jgi:hexosaminidase
VTPATSLDPLNRLVDAAHPESDKAREFATMVDAYLAGKADADIKTKMRQWLIAWRDNDAKLQTQISGSFLLKEDATLSHSLSDVGVAGLQAIGYIESGERGSNDWASQWNATLTDGAKPSAQLLLMVVAPVQKLVNAAGIQTSPAH